MASIGKSPGAGRRRKDKYTDSLEEFLAGDEPKYVIDTNWLVNVSEKDSLVDTEKKIVDHSDRLIKVIQDRKKKQIEKRLHVGRTNVQKANDSVDVDPMDPETWDPNKGIRERWSDHQIKEDAYAKDGMIIICVITKNQVPKGSSLSHKQYALKLRQRLQHHHMLKPEARDDKDDKKTPDNQKELKDGYVLYITFTYKTGDDTDQPNLKPLYPPDPDLIYDPYPPELKPKHDPRPKPSFPDQHPNPYHSPDPHPVKVDMPDKDAEVDEVTQEVEKLKIPK